ncbi:TetR/AcrR family transcriptional regulator [Sphingomonas mucosissima]|uniref:TetR/AcrR family transcriptional regulator n=1 Tax=Sphingomonas mucosissima TaxID=370959 RepID=UPI001FE67C68|nr:TetR/AcrR family transcriptional regulator [Sphingomonas mucosissima]
MLVSRSIDIEGVLPYLKVMAAKSSRTQAERSETMRARILDATIASLAQHGYGATTTLMVQKIAGLSRGAMLHHFPTKADLILGTMERIVDLNHEFFQPRLMEIPDPLQRFLSLIDARWDLAKQPHGVAQAEIMVGARSDELVRERYPEVLERMRPKQARRLQAWASDAGLLLDERDQAVSRAIVYALRGMAIEVQIDPTIETESVLGVLRDLRRNTLGDRIKPFAR